MSYVDYQLDPMGQPRFFGIYRGTVVENADPLRRSRLRLKLPALFGTDVTNWAEACLPVVVQREHGDNGTHIATTSSEGTHSHADGGSSGAHTHTVTLTKHKRVPDVGDRVWVMFEAGNPDFPVWIGVR